MGCCWEKTRLGLCFVLNGLLLTAGFLSPARAQVPGSAFTIDTYAGSDHIRDGGQATEALLYRPSGVALDGAGNIYIADTRHNVVRRVAPDGTISTVAGTGVPGRDENVPAVEADTQSPLSVITDGVGNIYFATGTQRVMRVGADGILTTLAGNGQFGFEGDGGLASAAKLASPQGLAIDAVGNIYIADQGNHRVRRVDVDGVITTVAGTGVRGFSGDGGQATAAQLDTPRDVAVDGAGNLYISDERNQRIRHVAPDGVITTVAGDGSFSNPVGGTATAVGLQFPKGIHAAADGTLHAAGSGYVVRIGTDGMLNVLLSSRGFAGDGGPAAQAAVEHVPGLDIGADGTIFLADPGNDRIRAIGPDGIINSVVGRSHIIGDTGPADQAVLFAPTGAEIDAEGNLYVAEAENRVVRKIDRAGMISTIAGNGTSGNAGDNGPAIAAQLNHPRDIAIGPNGAIYVADIWNSRVRKISADGTITAYAGSGVWGYDGDGGPATAAMLQEPTGIAFDSKGNLYIADSSAHVVRRVDTAGTISTYAGTGERGSSGDGGPAVEAQLSSPNDLFADADDNIYLMERGNRGIRRIDTSGIITRVVEHSRLIPSAVIEPNDGILFIESLTSALMVAWANGSPQPFSTGALGFGGDGGSAQDASFSEPQRLTVAPDGRIFVCDMNNHRVRVLTPTPVVTDDSATNAASFASGAAAAESILSWFGWNLAGRTDFASSTPLPDTLGDGTTSFKDSAGTTHPVGNFFASGRQRNLYVPSGVARGVGSLTVTNVHGRSAATDLDIREVVPGLFTFNGSGAGVVAATGLRLAQGGARSAVEITEFDAASSPWIPKPIDLGPEGDQIYLTIFCTGLRGRSDLSNVTATIGGVAVQVAYAGEQVAFVGLDQLNIGPIPRSLIGAGEVTIQLTVDGVAANAVTMAIQ